MGGVGVESVIYFSRSFSPIMISGIWGLIKDKDELIVAQVCMREGIPS